MGFLNIVISVHQKLSSSSELKIMNSLAFVDNSEDNMIFWRTETSVLINTAIGSVWVGNLGKKLK